MVIVGAGAAGCSAAETLRRLDYPGEIVVFDRDPAAPYDRPPLSKAVLGAAPPVLDEIQLLSREELRKHRITLHAGTSVLSCDPEGRTVTIDTGDRVAYSDLIIATGLVPRTHPAVPRELALQLNSWGDAQRIRSRLNPGDEVLIVGAGFLGLELAATATDLGCEVTVLASSELPLARKLGADVARKLVAEHEARGVQFLKNEIIERVAPQNSGQSTVAHFGSGASRGFDHIIVAIGSQPQVEWCQTLASGDGLLCDAEGKVRDGVWAAGDIAAWRDERSGRQCRREHRSNANEQGAAVAHAILGRPAPLRRSPFFWTDQYDVKIQVWGSLPPDAQMTVLSGSLEEDSFVLGATAVPDTPPDGLIAWNSVRAALPHRAELDKRYIAVSRGM